MPRDIELHLYQLMSTTTPSRVSTHPSGVNIEFFEEDHRYQIREKPEVEFTSSTTWIKKFFPEFERERISAAYARKHGLRQEDVLAEWDEKSRIARERGTLVHECAERAIGRYLENGEVLSIDELWSPEMCVEGDEPTKTLALVEAMHEAICKMTKVLKFRETEWVIASPELQIAGMVDLVVNLDTPSGPKVGLYDWKTNAKIDQANPWQTGLGPLVHLSDCNFHHYALQLNLYEYLCRKEGYFPEETQFQKVIIHLGRSGYKTYKCPDMQKEIFSMLESESDSV